MTNRSNNANETVYMHTDHLGSIDAITYGSGPNIGKLKEQNSFDAWGARRFSNWTVGTPGQLIASTTTRGFTGHEMEDGIGLINMRARMYDPILGRFLQADTYIQYPDSTQGLNRYTYVNNNPLSYTDPSGHFSLGQVVGFIANPGFYIQERLARPILLKYAWARQAGSIAASVYGGPEGAAAFAAYLTAISGGTMSDIAKSAAIAWVTATAFNAIGDGMQAQMPEGGMGPPNPPTLNATEGVLAHGLVGGASSQAQGGTFRDGFRGAVVGKVVTLGTPNMGVGPAQFAIATVSGGLASAAGGGKFQDGATSAAMGYIFNAAAHAVEKYYSNDKIKRLAFEMNQIGEENASRVSNFEKAIGLATDVVGAFRGGVSIESGALYFEKIDTVEVERQWYESGTNRQLGTETIGQAYQVRDMSGTSVEDYAYIGNGMYKQYSTIVGGMNTRMKIPR